MKRKTWLTAMAVIVTLAAALSGCGSEGDTGPTGPPGPAMPVIASISATGLPPSPGGTVTVQVSAQSPQGLALTYAWTVTPAGWTIASGQGTDTIDITAPSAYGSAGSAQVLVSDTEGRSGMGLISLSTEGNFAPVIHSISALPNPVYRGGQMVIDAYATDPNGDMITYTWAAPLGFSLVSGQGTATIVIEATGYANGTVTLTADDGAGGSSPGAIGVSVLDAGAWGTAIFIETDNSGGAFDPQVAFDPSGDAIAVWRQSDGTRNNIWSNRYTAGTGWGTAALIETDNAGNAEKPQIAIDSSGNALAVWHQSDGTQNNVWSNRYTAGTGWGIPVLVETDDTGYANDPHVGFDSSGNALAVWHHFDGTRQNIWANRYASGTGWGTAVLIETDGGTASTPKIAVDSSGNAMAVWYQDDGTRNNIWANRYTAGTGWGTATLIETDNTAWAANPQVAVDSWGNALAVWYQSDGIRMNVWANRYLAGTGWGSAGLIETDNAGHARFPQVAIDSRGDVMAVWQQSDGVRTNIMANRYIVGIGWGAAVLVETDNAGNASDPQVAVDAWGNATVVWGQSDGTRVNIWSNRFTPGSGWGTAGLLETDNTGNAFVPQVASSPSGNAMAVWAQPDAIRDNIWANLFE